MYIGQHNTNHTQKKSSWQKVIQIIKLYLSAKKLYLFPHHHDEGGGSEGEAIIQGFTQDI